MADLLDGLTQEQLKGATAGGGTVAVEAGAGTGKTRTLAARIAWLLRTGAAEPSEIQAVTFTRKAAQEIKERLLAAIGPAAKAVRVGTFHGLSARILRRHPRIAGLIDEGFSIVDPEEVAILVEAGVDAAGAWPAFVPPEPFPGADGKAQERAVKAARREDREARARFVGACVETILRWKEAGIAAEDAADPERPRRGAHEERIATVFVAYQAELERRNMADYTDLLLRVVRMFDRHPEIARAEAEAVRHLLVDEYQDTNPVQARWTEHMSAVHGNLFVVGDPDQSIYAWRGARPALMAAAAGRAATGVALTLNRRCTDQILEPAVRLVDRNPRPKPKALRSGEKGAPVTSSSHLDEEDEASHVAKEIRKLLNAGAEPSRVAVLCRTSQPMQAIERALIAERVKYALAGGTALLDREEARDLMAYLRLAANPCDDLAFRRVVNKPSRGLGPAATDAICAAAARGAGLHEACLLFAGSRAGTVKAEARKAAGKLASDLRALTDAVRRGERAGDVVHLALVSTGYMDWLEAEGAEERIVNLKAMMRLADEAEDAIELLHDLSTATDADAPRDGERVLVSTMHAAKGLEFDHVFCPAFEKGVIPHPKQLAAQTGAADPDPWEGPRSGGVEEERRLAHVAFTRARKTLHLSCAATRNGRTAGPSPFFAEAGLAEPEASRPPKPAATPVRAKAPYASYGKPFARSACARAAAGVG